MKLECPDCKKGFEIPDERLPEGSEITFPCPACQGMITLDLMINATKEQRPGHAKQKEQPTGTALKKQILQNVKSLPPMPQTVLKARDIMENPDSDFKELGTLLETDQAIAVKVLRLANSSFYGLSGKVSTIQHASVVLGHKALGDLITMGGMSSILASSLEGYDLDAGDLWRHSLAVAFGARIIAEKKEPKLANDAFTSGLIHDAGKIILDPFIFERKNAFQEFMADSQQTFLTAERQILGLDHSEIASEVCDKWKLPRPLTVAIKYHHNPARSQGNTLTYIIHAADAVAMMTGLGLGMDTMAYQPDENAMELLGLDQNDVDSLMDEVTVTVQKISEQMH